MKPASEKTRKCKDRIRYAIRAEQRRATLAHRARREQRRAAGIILPDDYRAEGLNFITSKGGPIK